MDARLIRVALVVSVFSSMGANYSSPNFAVEAPTAELAQKVALVAEQCRDRIALDWLGRTLPHWYKPCQVRVKVGQIGAGGATTFAFDRGEVFGWNMNVQGTEERILDSVIPHEVSHTIFASHFRRPLPRWADEGAATLVEHESERHRQQLMLQQVFKTSQRIPLRQLLAMKEYPRDMQSVLTLYAQGYSLADFLVQNGGKARYLQFLEDAHRRDWNSAIKSFYGLKGTEDLETRWSGWVMAGSPSLALGEGEQLADASSAAGEEKEDGQVTIRSQNPEATAAPKALPLKPKKPESGDLHANLGRKQSAEALLGSVEELAAPQPPRRTRSAPAEERTNQIRKEHFAQESSAETAPDLDVLNDSVVVMLEGDSDADIERAARELEKAGRRIAARGRVLNNDWVPLSSDEARGDRRVAASKARQLPLTSFSVVDDEVGK